MYTLENMPFDDIYYGKTPNKYPRKGTDNAGKPYEYPPPEGAVLHETASPNPANPHGTLKFNLNNPPGTSYDYLIARDTLPGGYATIYRYVNPVTHISYHAGVNSAAMGHTGFNVKANLVGIELDGRNNGESVLPAQIKSLQLLAQWLYKHLGIVISSHNYIPHSVVAPRDPRGGIYKTDPRGYTRAVIDKAGLTFEHSPRITFSQFNAVIAANHPPMLTESNAIYKAFINAGIDPGVGLAFAYHEHRLNNTGVVPRYNLKNWGAVRSPWAIKTPIVSTASGPFAQYTSWLESVIDWIARIKGRYIGKGLFTVELALPVYAPTSDGNSPKNYIAAIYKYIDAWDNTPDSGQIPTGPDSYHEVPQPIKRYWDLSGGVWLADRFALGYLVGVEGRGADTIYTFERGRIRLNSNGSIDSMLANEA